MPTVTLVTIFPTVIKLLVEITLGHTLSNDRDGAMLSYNDVLPCQAQAQVDASPLDIFDVICEPPSLRHRAVRANAVAWTPSCSGE